MNESFFLELLLRSSVLLLTGCGLLALGRSASAAFRHRLLVFVFVSLALLPVMSVLLPSIPLSFGKPARPLSASVTIQEGPERPRPQLEEAALNGLLWIWVSGVVAACLPLAVGSFSIWRTARRALPFRTAVSEVLMSEDLAVPVTCGIFRPRILLPHSAQHWSPSRLQAVLLHESAHVRRRDVAVQLAVHLISALWWFQPLVWVLRRRLRAESEFACDAAAIISGFRASDYARELLGVASSVGAHWRLSSSALAMVRRGDLERRLRAVLNPRPAVSGPWNIYAVVIILGAVSVAASEVVYQD